MNTHVFSSRGLVTPPLRLCLPGAAVAVARSAVATGLNLYGGPAESAAWGGEVVTYRPDKLHGEWNERCAWVPQAAAPPSAGWPVLGGD